MPVGNWREQRRTGHRRHGVVAFWSANLRLCFRHGRRRSGRCDRVDQGLLKVDDPIDIVELTFVLDEVVAEARRLEILLAPLEAHSSAGVKRAEACIEFDAIGTEFSVSKLNRNVALGDRGLGLGVGVLAVSLNLETCWRWSNNRRSLIGRSGRHGQCRNRSRDQGSGQSEKKAVRRQSTPAAAHELDSSFQKSRFDQTSCCAV